MEVKKHKTLRNEEASINRNSLSLHNYENILKGRTLKPLALKDIIQDSKFLTSNLQGVIPKPKLVTKKKKSA